jgi:flagellar hook-basal body complex protein FliE
MTIPAIGLGPLGQGEWGISGLSGLGLSPAGAQSASAADATSPSFKSALTNAIGSLESTQATATSASEKLATGQLTDPSTAIEAVENASLSMDFASQIRNGVDTDVSTLMQSSF